MPRLAALLAMLLVAACPPPEPTTSPDAGSRTPRFATGPAPSAPPEAVTLTPCPQGWRELHAENGDPATCDPWPVGGPSACAADQAHFPGEPGCRAVGAACPAGDWAEGLPASGVLYVKAGAAAGGTGTRGAPFATVAQALAAASSGTVIALSAGTFTEVISLGKGVTLWGACPGLTTLAAPSAAKTGVVQVTGAGATVRDVRFTGPPSAVWVARAGASVTLAGVIVDRAAGVALVAGNGGAIAGHDVAVRDTQPHNGSGGWAVDVEAGGSIDLTRVVVSGSVETAMVGSGAGSTVRLTDASVRHTRARFDGQLGYAVALRGGASLTLTRAALEDSQSLGVALGDAAQGTFSDVVVRDTLPSGAASDLGVGLLVEAGATLTWTRGVVERNRTQAIIVRDAPSRATLRQLVVRDTAVEASTGEDGEGLLVQDGATAEVDHAFLARSHRSGVMVIAAHATLTDVEIAGTSNSEPNLSDGAGLQVSRGSTVTLERVRVARSERLGLFVVGPGSAVTGADVTVSDGRCNEGDRQNGVGAAIQEGGVMTLSRVAFLRNATVGLQLSDPGSTATLEDLLVEETASDLALGAFGRGFQVQGGARLVVRRGLVRRNADVGGLVLGGASATLDDLLLWDTSKAACVLDGRCSDVGGIGLAVVQDAGVRLARFELVGAASCGLQLGQGGVADLESGLVAENEIGVAVLDPDFDTSRLSSGVVYEKNVTNLSAKTLAVPLPIPRK